MKNATQLNNVNSPTYQRETPSKTMEDKTMYDFIVIGGGRSRYAKPKREINLADYIERLRGLQRLSKAPAKEDSQRKRRLPIKSAEKVGLQNSDPRSLRNEILRNINSKTKGGKLVGSKLIQDKTFALMRLRSEIERGHLAPCLGRVITQAVTPMRSQPERRNASRLLAIWNNSY